MVTPGVAASVKDFPVIIRFATRRDQKKLQEICVAAGMDLAGEVEEHVVIKQDSVLIGGAMLAQTDNDAFHLLLIAVDETYRGNGSGGRLLQALLGDPWSCCRDALDGSGKSYRVTTVARGTEAGFYRKHGFAPCDFADLADPFRDQCECCPDRDGCHPVAMRFDGVTAGQPEERRGAR
jgi:N-acetylglutamate synthase-like GNAT family acetyltransferase